jgi:hypothetical protein
MDNILKLLLTSNLTFEPQSQSQPQSQSETPMLPPPGLQQSDGEPEEEGEEFTQDDEVTEASEEDGDDIFAVGEPMIDGNPYGTNGQAQVQSDRPMIPEIAQPSGNNFSQAAPPSYDPQQYYAPQPAQGAYAPAFAEGQ